MEIKGKSFFLLAASLFLFFSFLLFTGAGLLLDSLSKGPVVTPTTGANNVLSNYPETRRLLESAWTTSQKDPQRNYLEPVFRKLFIADQRSGFLDLGFMEHNKKNEVLEKACKDSRFDSLLKTFIDSPTKANATEIESLLQQHGFTSFY